MGQAVHEWAGSGGRTSQSILSVTGCEGRSGGGRVGWGWKVRVWEGLGAEANDMEKFAFLCLPVLTGTNTSPPTMPVWTWRRWPSWNSLEQLASCDSKHHLLHIIEIKFGTTPFVNSLNFVMTPFDVTYTLNIWLSVRHWFTLNKNDCPMKSQVLWKLIYYLKTIRLLIELFWQF